MESLLRKAAKFMQSRRKNKRWRNLVTCLAAVVVFGTTYALILPAITIDDEAAQQEPGLVLIQDDSAVQEMEVSSQETEEAAVVQAAQPEESEDSDNAAGQDDVAIGAAEEEPESGSLQEVPADLQTIDISALDAETKTLSFEGEEYKVTVAYDESAGIPEGASLKAEEIEAESEEYASLLATASQTLEEQDTTIHKARFFDISILDGENEIEPTSTVDVQISLAAEDDVDTDALIVTHEDELISTVDTTEEEDGTVTLAFETESFSDYGVISPSESQTISVGDTVTLQGTSSNKSHSWSASPEGVVEISGDTGTNEVTVTGVAAGTTKVTHKYHNKTEYFTITVTDMATLTDTASGYTVTVKGNKKVLTDDVTLHVEDYAETASDYKDYYDALVTDLETAASKESITESDFDFLHMYHIYLTKTGVDGEYVPEDNVNLQVTITYDTAPTNWSKVNWVGHYKKKSNGEISRQSISDDSTSSTGVKQIHISENSITFHIQSFSIFPVAALASDEGDDNSGGGSTGGGSTSGGTGSSVANYLTTSGANSWQIVSGGYEGNSSSYKTTSSDGNVRVQKNVIPTNVENEFLVYLSIDTKQLFADYFASATYHGTTSNNYHDSQLGTVVDSMTGNLGVKVTGKAGVYSNHAQFTILSSSGELLAENITLYWSQANNVTLYLEVNDNGKTRYVLTGLEIKSGDSEVIQLSSEAEELIMSNIAQMANLTAVTDQMGDYIEFMQVVAGDYTSKPTYNNASKTLTWYPVVKTNPTIDKVQTEESKTVSWTDHDGNIRQETVYKYTSWALNVSELVYKVRLNVEASGFNSCADKMNSTTADSCSYPVNNSAELTYNDGKSTVTFQQPYVRGLLYDFTFQKVDENNKPLKDAIFTATTDDGKGYTTTASSNSNGKVSFESLPWGTYTVMETKAPSGYTKSKESASITLCYTTARSGLVQSGTHMMSSALASTSFVNKRATQSVILKKVATGTNTPLSGAVFTLYKEVDDSEDSENSEDSEDSENIETETITVGEEEKTVISVGTGLISDSEDDGIFYKNESLENGTYYLVETAAPNGYNKLADAITFTVSADGVQASGNYVTVTDNEEEKEAEDEVTIYTISITNSTGYKLPDTGGSGTTWFTFGGLAILAGCLMAGYRMRRKRERRSY